MRRKDIIVTAVFVLFVFITAVLFAALPKKTYSENEKRILSELKKPSAETVLNGEFVSDTEKYINDHFPLRDVYVGINAYLTGLLGRNGESGVYRAKDGYLITAPKEFDAKTEEKNIRSIEKFCENAELDATLMLVPTAGFMLEEKLPKFHETYGDDEIIETAKKSKLEFVDLRETLDDEGQVYYRTDHHLTSYGSLLMYRAYCESRGITPPEFTKVKEVDGFYGTAYSKSGLWLTKPDTVEIYSTDTDYTVTVDDGNGENVYRSLYFESHFDDMDKYPVFLDGNHALVKIHNNGIQNGKKLLIIKDSYAHCFTTFLAEHYEDIYTVDMRYYRASVKKLVSENEISEALVLYGTENFATSTDITWLNVI